MQRIYLVTPEKLELESFSAVLEATLKAGEVAAVLIASGGTEADRLAIAHQLVPVAQDHGSAAIVLNSRSIAEETGADGIHIDEGTNTLQGAIDQFKPGRIVGVGGNQSRHIALERGELDIDYLFFGDPLERGKNQPNDQDTDLAKWWSEMTEIPAVIMVGPGAGNLQNGLDTGADFIAANEAIWSDPDGPTEAMKRLCDALKDGTGS